MANAKPQQYSNHTKLDPLFHFLMAPVALITLGLAIQKAWREPTAEHGWFVVMAATLLVAFFRIRIYSLKVQDRVIRLEETLRMQKLLPAANVDGLSVGQLVALRFAADAELANLVEKTLANNWKNKEIKQAVVTWRPDHFRV